MPENRHAGADSVYGFDARVAHPARVYDYWLGGKDNFAADRIAGEETIAAYPAIRASARANRAFLARSVRYLAAEAGIRQFLDIGTGLPTASNTHEVAQSVAPDSRIVYVDNDPLVLAHARALLTSRPEGATAYLDADLRDVDEILEQAAGTLDLTQPVGVMLLAILHYIPDLDQARRIMARLVSAIPSGSFVTISHAASDISPEAMAEMIKRMNQHLAEANHVGRTRDVVAGFFDGLDLLEPGVVKVTQWRPASDVEAGGPTSMWGGVGRKPLPVQRPAASGAAGRGVPRGSRLARPAGELGHALGHRAGGAQGHLRGGDTPGQHGLAVAHAPVVRMGGGAGATAGTPLPGDRGAGGVGGGADGRLELVHRFRGGCGYLFTPFPHRRRDGLPGRVELLARIVRLTNHGRIISSRASSGQGRPRSGKIRPLSPPSGVHIGPSVSSSW
jgi:hypothetical protein